MKKKMYSSCLSNSGWLLHSMYICLREGLRSRAIPRVLHGLQQFQSQLFI